MVKLRDIVIPAFYEAHRDIKERKHTHYWFKGGRGSTKSSFISLEIIYNVIRDPECNVICFRKIGKDIEESVYNQILWAIDALGVNDYFKAYKSPYRIVYTPTGQVIAFRGLDDATKTKSIKLKKGYYKISWFEELDEFCGVEEIRKAEQSVMRGGNQFIAFKSYNPPQNVNNWVNKEVIHDRPDRLVTHNTYLDVPREWLGEQFFIEADFLKGFNELAFRHEYMGEITGTGGLIFQNVRDLRMSDELIASFDNLREGIDWGFAADPFVWLKLHYDKTRRCIYIYDEVYKVQLTNPRAMEIIKPRHQTLITADSAEPKSVEEFQSKGFKIYGARKGPDSIRYGIKWLQQLAYIYIDKERCPHAYEEFSLYELEKDKNGEFKDKYPDKNNHCLTGDTLIMTLRGQIPIKDVTTNDYVLTRKGYKKVLWSGVSAKNVQVYKMFTQKGLTLTGTYNHKIYTNTGFRDMINLRYGDELLTLKDYKKWLNEKQSNMIINYGTDTQMQKEAVTAIISRKAVSSYITMFGKNITERAKKVIVYIIKMVILPIMILIILKKLLLNSIWQRNINLAKNEENNSKNGVIQSDHLQKNGIVQKTGIDGTKNMQKNTDLVKLTMEQLSAKSAEKNLKKQTKRKNFVQTLVNQNIEGLKGLIILQKLVKFVEKSLLQTNIPKQDFVQDNVQTIICGNIEKEVYDLTVDECHEFFANGILVHNCIDSVRYALEDDMSNNFITAVTGLSC